MYTSIYASGSDENNNVAYFTQVFRLSIIYAVKSAEIGLEISMGIIICIIVCFRLTRQTTYTFHGKKLKKIYF